MTTPFTPPSWDPDAPSQSVPVAVAPQRKGPKIALAVAAALVLALIPLSAISYATTGSVPLLYTDPGIRACQALHDRVSVGHGFANARKQFARSHYQDIRDAGTKAMDTAAQFDTLKDSSDLGAALVLGGPLIQSWGSLVGACGNHGIEVPQIGK